MAFLATDNRVPGRVRDVDKGKNIEEFGDGDHQVEAYTFP